MLWVNVFRHFSVVIAFVLMMSGTLQAQERRVIINKGADYFGGDYRTLKKVPLSGCSKACLADAKCKAFTYNRNAKWCFLKNTVGELKSFKGATAGRVVANKQADAPKLKKPEKLPFLSARYYDKAIGYEKLIIKRHSKKAVSDEGAIERAIRSEQNGQLGSASGYYEQATGINPTSFHNWFNLARTVLTAKPENKNERYHFPLVGLHASIRAHMLSTNKSDRAESLALLATALERRKQYRAAMGAYKSSLALVNSVVLRQKLSKLRAAYGFRVLKHTVNADTSAPRICIQFSENLVKSEDYSSFISIDGQAVNGLDVEQRQLCVNGVSHGKRYEIALRAGLRSVIKDEPLLKSVALSVFVRDRKSTMRFTGSNFVLPRVGAKGIPVVSINTNKAKFEIYRVGERAVSRAVDRNKFLNALDGYGQNDLEDTLGVKVWSGTLEIASVLNKEVTTSFPVDKALADRKPGVYVMVAAPLNAKSSQWENKATQWFVISDIGLTTMSGSDGLHVFARSLATADPLENVEIQLLSKSNEVLGTGKTDANGYLKVPAGLLRGEKSQSPRLVLARIADSDFVIVNLSKSSIDLSDRGVMGRSAPGPLDAFMYLERGVYRPGEKIHITSLLRDNRAVGVDGLPLTVKIERPDGKLEATRVINNKGAGGYSLSYKLENNAMLGTWNIRLYTDPKSSPITEKRVLVEQFVPDRIEFDLTADKKFADRKVPTKISIDGRYLFGAPAADMAVQGKVRFVPTHRLSGFDGFVFGLDDAETTASSKTLSELQFLDENGKFSFALDPVYFPKKTGLFKANLAISMSENGGRAVERTLSLPVALSSDVIGIKANFENGSVREGETANFEIIGVGSDQKRISLSGLKWKLVKLERRYQWYSSGGGWSYDPVVSTKKISEGTVDALSETAGTIGVSVKWGRYRLEVSAGEGGPVSSTSFTAGWYVPNSSTETPDGLEIGLDKPSYRAGEVARLKISPRFAGKALVTIGSETLLWSKSVEVAKAGTVIEIPVGNNWGSGAYVNVVLYRPGDVAANRMPSRAIGVKWLKLDPAMKTLDVKLNVPEQVKPRGKFDVPVVIGNMKEGEQAYVTVAMVDVGILNLTNYKAPTPGKWFFGQRKMGLAFRDVYGKLIDGFAGTKGKIRSGGDASDEMSSKGSPPTQKLVAFYSGIVSVDASGKAVVSFDIPQFNGTVRLMAVAWSKTKIGSATKDVIIRDPIVLTATVPRFLTPGDQSTLRVDIANTDGPAGDYQLKVETFGKLQASLPVAGMTVSLSKGAQTAVSIPVSALRIGKGVLSVSLSSIAGPNVSQALSVPVRAPQLPVSRRQTVKLAANGGQLTVDQDFTAGYLPGSSSVTVGVSRAAGLDVPSLLLALDRYPYGCAEQTTSRALPLLYLSEVAGQTGMGSKKDINKRIQGAISRIVGFQSASGSFGMWAPGSDNLWLDSYVSDFLTRAREEGFNVPDEALKLALDNLSNSLSYDNNIEKQGNEIAYALYVLARNKRASISDLRYYVRSQLAKFKSPLAKAQLAAALGLYGEKAPSERAFNAAFNGALTTNAKLVRDAYGSSLRDRAAILALAAEARPAMSFVPEMVKNVSRARAESKYSTTQENAWLLLAARSLYANSEKIALEVNGQPYNGNLSRKLTSGDIQDGLTVANRSDENLEAAITISGIPTKALPAGGEGFSIVREYYTQDGKKVDPSTVAQNERFVVVLKIREFNKWGSRIIVNDLLPAGFEIDNPRMVSSADLGNFKWLKRVQPALIEFKADRFVAAFNRRSGDAREIMLAYVVRAVSPGKYIHPAAVVEDMYRPHLSARTAQGMVEVVGAKP